MYKIRSYIAGFLYLPNIAGFLKEAEIQAYVDGKEWVGCCGYKIEGELAGYVKKIIGSYSGVIGLPLFETKNLLNGAGVK